MVVKGWNRLFVSCIILLVFWAAGGSGDVAEQTQPSVAIGPRAGDLTSPPAPTPPASHVNSIGMEFVLVSPGAFLMGAGDGTGAVSEDEQPQHRVTISRPFYLGRYEVTQEHWARIMGSNPSHSRSPSNPVERVSWNDVQRFITRLMKQEPDQVYRLPTEAEWEYACRAGSTERFSFGAEEWMSKDYIWCYRSTDSTAKRVGSLRPNAWGLHDMHGNVWEWCQDWYGRSYYSQSPQADPRGPDRGSRRVMRGGAWTTTADGCRASARQLGMPDDRNWDIGFRLVRTIR